MSSQSEGRFVWIALSVISVLSAVSAITTIVDDDLVFTSAAIFWMATTLGAAIAAVLVCLSDETVGTMRGADRDDERTGQ